MESFVEKLNGNRCDEKHVLRFGELRAGKKYTVLSMKVSGTKYGPKLLLDLSDDILFFLPERFNSTISEHDIQCFNYATAAGINLRMERCNQNLVFSVENRMQL